MSLTPQHWDQCSWYYATCVYTMIAVQYLFVMCYRGMAVVKRGPGHCLVLCCILLLLAVGGHTARDTIDVVKGRNEGSKTPPHAEPPPAPDQGAHPDNPAQKQPQQLAANDGVRAGYLAEADLRDQRLGGGSFEDQPRMGSAAGRAAQLEPEQQQQPPPQQRFRGAEILASGTVGNVEQQPEEQPGTFQEQKSQSTGSKGAAREGLQQPKALHDEQFPGNGAQVCLALSPASGPSSLSHPVCAAPQCGLTKIQRPIDVRVHAQVHRPTCHADISSHGLCEAL